MQPGNDVRGLTDSEKDDVYALLGLLRRGWSFEGEEGRVWIHSLSGVWFSIGCSGDGQVSELERFLHPPAPGYGIKPVDGRIV